MLRDRLNRDMKDAMRARDQVRLRTIRLLRAALLEKEIAERRDGEAELTEEQVVAVLQKQAKQRKDALEHFESAGRDDLAAIEKEELEIIELYLPEQLSEDAIRKEVEAVIAESGAESMRDMGRVMGPVMKRLRGLADGRVVQSIVRELLG